MKRPDSVLALFAGVFLGSSITVSLTQPPGSVAATVLATGLFVLGVVLGALAGGVR